MAIVQKFVQAILCKYRICSSHVRTSHAYVVRGLVLQHQYPDYTLLAGLVCGFTPAHEVDSPHSDDWSALMVRA